jgi:surfactin synthase thioesterase subunit
MAPTSYRLTPTRITLQRPVRTQESRAIGKRLFAVSLGGRAARCNTELHDVVFAVGDSIEETYEHLMDKWFGDPLRLHLDSWFELRIVDGHHIHLEPTAESQVFAPNNGYPVIPPEVVAAYAAKRKIPAGPA